MGQDKEVVPGWTFTEPAQTVEKDTGWSYSVPAKELGGTIGQEIGLPQPVRKAPPKKQNILQKMGFTQANPVWATMTGIPEAAMATASGIPGFFAGLAAQASSAAPKIMAGENVLGALGSSQEAKDAVAGALTYQPKTTTGQAFAQIPAAPFELMLSGVDAAAKLSTKDPNKQAGIRYLAELSLAFGIKPAKGYIERVIASKKPLSMETLIKFVDENLSPELAAEAKKNLANKYAPKEEPTPVAGKLVEEAKKSAVAEETAQATAWLDWWQKQHEGEGVPFQEGAVRGGSTLPTQPLPKRVGPINLERLDMGDSAKRLVADMEDHIHLARVKSGRQHVTWNESEAMANRMGGAYEIGQILNKTAEEVLEDFGKSTKNLDAKVEATRTVYRTAFQDAQAKAKKAIEEPGMRNEAEAQIAYNRWGLIQYELGQGSGEIARALNIHKKLARSKEYLITKNYMKVLKELGHDKLTPEAMQLLAAWDESNPLGGMKLLAGMKKATTRQKMFELWMNSILSNPSTHIVNLSSNFVFEGMSPFEKALGAGVEFIKHPLKPDKREMYFGEAIHSAVGAFAGIREGLRNYAYAMKHGVTQTGLSKFEIPTKAIKGIKGEIVRLPTKELMASDDMMKAVIYMDEMYSRAYREATKTGFRGDLRKAKMAELLSNPTEEMVAASKKQAQVRTFQNELGKIGKAFIQFRNQVPGVEFIIPFVRTPINIMKEGLRRTPLGALELHRLKGAERSVRIGQVAVSSAAAVLLAKAVAEGNVTGSGPSTPSERQAWLQTGARPYSVKIGGTYYSYGRLEPIATILGTIADYHEIHKAVSKDDATKIVAKITAAIRNNITSKTFFTGLTDISNATTDPGRYGEQVIKRMATSVVPAVVAGAARAIDPEIKEANKIIDWYKARLPFLSKQVPPKINAFGEPRLSGGTPTSRFISPVAISESTKDPVYLELDRLGLNVAQQQPVIAGKKMDKVQIRKLTEEGGPEVKAHISMVINSPFYKSLSDENKKKLLKSQIAKVRGIQKNLFILEEANK